MLTVHGTTVAIDGAGVLLRGASGSGKSDLALRLIDRGAVLIADDRSVIERCDDGLTISAPTNMRGVLEVRGIGLLRMPMQETACLRLAIDLDGAVERMPEPQTAKFLGLSVPLLRLCAFESSAPAKIRLAVRTGPDDIVL